VFADPKRVGRRRIARRLKAAASIVVAVAAGTFLACHRQVAKLTGDGSADDTSGADGAAGGRADAATPDAGIEVRQEDGTPLAGDAALVVADVRSDALARSRDGSPADAAVDVHQHRKGMPVPDNLLE
jgi:hypothetical protein